ncbi:hypothetical protein EDF67_103141 [Sphingobacterium sp. JUb78]|nr:hypothetical protein [Sphingobacterium kitahiroshimense]TCR11728.1 hypothetical protein EDF67_103141 [Sphingobacterium sp. JUb78]
MVNIQVSQVAFALKKIFNFIFSTASAKQVISFPETFDRLKHVNLM